MSMFWSIGFCCVLNMTSQITGGSLNPAIGFAINLTMAFDKKYHAMQWVWIYLIFPFIGAIVAVLFYHLVYLRTKLMEEVDEEYEAEENDEGKEESLLDH